MTFKRKTIVSNAVIDRIKTAAHAQSFGQISDHLDQLGLTPNKTTLYRILDKGVQQQLFQAISLNNGLVFYEWAKKKPHHHHFFCTACTTLFCLDACHLAAQQISLSTLLPNSNFQITHHDFNLYGMCDTCRTTSTKPS